MRCVLVAGGGLSMNEINDGQIQCTSRGTSVQTLLSDTHLYLLGALGPAYGKFFMEMMRNLPFSSVA